jgi:hypothetical protein
MRFCIINVSTSQFTTFFTSNKCFIEYFPYVGSLQGIHERQLKDKIDLAGQKNCNSSIFFKFSENCIEREVVGSSF